MRDATRQSENAGGAITSADGKAADAAHAGADADADAECETNGDVDADAGAH
jgi:hypothetical protein